MVPLNLWTKLWHFWCCTKGSFEGVGEFFLNLNFLEVPAAYFLFAGTVLAAYSLFAGMVPAYNLFQKIILKDLIQKRNIRYKVEVFVSQGFIFAFESIFYN